MIKNDSQAPSCTCPSGDGSLVHPCPAHPAVEQVGGDERAAFEQWLEQHMSHHFSPELDLAKYEDSGEYRYNPAADYWKAWQARAALEQSSPTPVCTTPTGENCPGDGVKSCKKCPEQAEAEAEAEQPEVVAFIHERTGAVANAEMVRAMEEGSVLSGYSIGLVTLAQHDRIVGALRADRDSWAEQAEQRLADWDEMRKERDAALARVAEMEAKLAEMEKQVAVAWGAFHFGGERDGKLYTHCETEAQIDAYILDMHRSSDSLTLRKSPLYAAPVAQAQHSVPEEFIGRLSEFLAQRGATGKALLRELRAMLAAEPTSSASPSCKWTESSGIWETGCGQTWGFVEDGPAENGALFCHHCGGRLVLIKSDDHEDDGEPCPDCMENAPASGCEA
ncbi:hypothetical protein [Pseudomonas aeruginosa]|uniref:hypothetical protein n=1 Tax=Pseudomonas aeruginosa TaxID=287 RepID=UPI002F416A4A